MAIHFYTPQFPLSTFVDVIWLYDGYAPSHTQERALPTGTATLVISFVQRIANFAGAYSQPIQLDIAQLVSHIGVHFRAGGAGHFFAGLPGFLVSGCNVVLADCASADYLAK